jgi:hypothetical protein
VATKKIKTEYTVMDYQFVAGQRIELLLKYIDSNKAPIDISALEFWSEWRDTKKELIAQISSTGVGNLTGTITKSPGDGINAFKLIIFETNGFKKLSGTFDVWTIDTSFVPDKNTPIIFATWKSELFPTDQANLP